MLVANMLTDKGNRVATVKSSDLVSSATKMLKSERVGALVVSDDGTTIAGIISERDIVRNIAERSVSALDTAIETAMTKDIIIGFPEDALSDVSSTMTNRRIRHLPIVEDKDLIGMISIGDIVKAQLDHAEHEAHNLRQYITGGYS